jgi:hypothetical protein
MLDHSVPIYITQKLIRMVMVSMILVGSYSTKPRIEKSDFRLVLVIKCFETGKQLDLQSPIDCDLQKNNHPREVGFFNSPCR